MALDYRHRPQAKWFWPGWRQIAVDARQSVEERKKGVWHRSGFCQLHCCMIEKNRLLWHFVHGSTQLGVPESDTPPAHPTPPVQVTWRPLVIKGLGIDSIFGFTVAQWFLAFGILVLKTTEILFFSLCCYLWSLFASRGYPQYILYVCMYVCIYI